MVIAPKKAAETTNCGEFRKTQLRQRGFKKLILRQW
jgi:hypothetical protein